MIDFLLVFSTYLYYNRKQKSLTLQPAKCLVSPQLKTELWSAVSHASRTMTGEHGIITGRKKKKKKILKRTLPLHPAQILLEVTEDYT
jgi:hypothetical protein